MDPTSDLLEKLSELYEVAPSELRPNIDLLFEDLIIQIRSSLDFARVQPELDSIPAYAERTDKTQSSMSFFLEHYGALMKSGAFYIDNLRHHDQRLYTALASFQAERNAKLSDLLPRRPKPTRGGPKPIAELRAVKFG